MQVVEYNNIKYNIPFDVDLTLDKKNKLIKVTNPFSGESAMLPWFAVAIYDLIIGAQHLEEYETVQEGCDWFAKHFPKEYMTLLD